MTPHYDLVTPADNSTVVPLADFKAFARIDSSAEDTVLQAQIDAAVEHVRQSTRRALLTETWALYLDQWPLTYKDAWWNGVREAPITSLEVDLVKVERAPFLAVSAVETLDEAGSATAWASSNWYSLKHHYFGRLVRKRGSVWPTPGRDVAGIKITFTAGYATVSDIPSDLVMAIKMMALHWMDNRQVGAECVGTSDMPHGVSSVIAKYRVLR